MTPMGLGGGIGPGPAGGAGPGLGPDPLGTIGPPGPSPA